MQKNIRVKLKNFLIKALAITLKGLAYLKDKLPFLARLLSKPLEKIGRLFLFFLILPIYKIYLTSKKLANKFYAPHKIRNRILHPFSRRYLTHLIIIVISIFTIASNLNAYETRLDELNQTSVIASLNTEEDLGAIVEEGPISISNKVTHYLGQTSVAVKQQLGEGDFTQETITPTVSGGSAIVRPILSPAEENLRQRDKIVYYTIQIGDTISDVAEKFGISVSTILWENNLTAYSLIRPGDKLTILPTSGIKYKVVKGDTIAKIAKKYDVEPGKIVEFNKLASEQDIAVGEELLIPGAKKISTAPTYTVRSLAQTAPAARVASSGKMNWPNSCRRVTQYFTWRHSGVDIACPFGSTIYAAAAGVVIKAQGGWNGGYGNYIIINHGGTQTLYGHLSRIFVEVGQVVNQGTAIGAEGSSGRSTGPHLHFEVRSGGVRRNPFSYVR
ncbi:MAG: M23 family metallopeptidase [Candidatus Buchananbacteria bacterium]